MHGLDVIITRNKDAVIREYLHALNESDVFRAMEISVAQRDLFPEVLVKAHEHFTAPVSV